MKRKHRKDKVQNNVPETVTTEVNEVNETNSKEDSEMETNVSTEVEEKKGMSKKTKKIIAGVIAGATVVIGGGIAIAKKLHKSKEDRYVEVDDDCYDDDLDDFDDEDETESEASEDVVESDGDQE